MSLANAYVTSTGRLKQFLDKIQAGQAPAKVTTQHLKDIGFKSTNDRPFIKVLKELKFLTPDGVPTARYQEYRDKSKAPKVLGEALREVYSDLFVISSEPSKANKDEFQGKFKSTFNTSDTVAELCATTFLTLLEKADIKQSKSSKTDEKVPDIPPQTSGSKKTESGVVENIGLHYNIQVHLPATKDIEVYNSIFRSIKDNLIE